MNDIFLGIQILDTFTKKFELFERDLNAKYDLLDFFVFNQTYNMRQLYREIPAITFAKLIQNEFISCGNDPVIAAFLFDRMMTWEVSHVFGQQEQIKKFNQFAVQAKRRIAQLEKELEHAKAKENSMENILSANIPAISVIIAMYNTEKYIGECLESFLAQTFQDFEVIVIDDCSTDNSNAVVTSYAEKFGGRLNLFRLPKNSGNNGIPNNMGLSLSRGEYVLFMDSDDTVTPDALEKLYTAAKNFNADVVGTEKFYNIPDKFWNNAEYRRQMKPYSYQKGGFVSQPTLISADLSERVKDCYNKRFLWNIWSKLIRRDFLIENEITITNEMANDMLLTCFLVYSVEKYVRIPDVINFYRVVDTSLTHTARDSFKQLKKYCSALRVGFEHLDKFLSGREFFKQNPAMKYLAFETYVREILSYLDKIYGKLPMYKFDEILREEFSKGDNSALMTFIFGAMNVYKLKILQNFQRVNELEKVIRHNREYISELEKRLANSSNE